jgi:sensor histidine kinase YesM
MFVGVIYLVVSVALSMPDVTTDFLFSSSYGRMIYVITVNAVVTSLTFVLIRIAKRSVDSALKLRVIAVSTSLLVANMTVLLLLLEYASVIPDGLLSPIILVISAVAIFIANILVLWMFHHINEQNARVMQLTATEQRIAMQAKHQEQIGQIEQELRKFRHDIHNHFQFLLAYAESHESDKVESYLRELVVSFDTMAMTVSTGNPIADAILNVKAHVANQNSIDFDVDAYLPTKLPVSDNDIVIIFGNILDNAIEASLNLAQKDERCIKVMAHAKNNTLVMTVINAYTDAPRKKGIKRLAGKFKGETRGLGLQIVANRVSSYGGYVNTKAVDQVFEASIIIPIT